MRAHHYLVIAVVCIAIMSFYGASTSLAADKNAPANQITLLAEKISGGYLEIDGTKGMGVYPDLFYEAGAASGVDVVFRYVPWGRAFHEVERSSHLLTFPLTRLPVREAKYSWLVSLDRDEIVFLSRNAPVDTLGQARNLQRILVWKGSSMEIFLKKQGFTNLTTVGTTAALIRMLRGKRADAWFTVRPENVDDLNPPGEMEKIVAGQIIHTESVWLTGGKSFVHSDASRRFSAALDKLVKAGRLKELKARLRAPKQ